MITKYRYFLGQKLPVLRKIFSRTKCFNDKKYHSHIELDTTEMKKDSPYFEILDKNTPDNLIQITVEANASNDSAPSYPSRQVAKEIHYLRKIDF